MEDRRYDEEVKKGAKKMTGKDLSRVVREADRILEIVGRVSALKKFAAQAALLIRMLSDYFEGNYTEVPWKTIAMAVFAFVYLLNPVDLILDYIPVVGYLDDAAVLALVWQGIKWDVMDYVKYACRHGLSDEKMMELAKEAFGEDIEC